VGTSTDPVRLAATQKATNTWPVCLSMTAATALKQIMDFSGSEFDAADAFDIICGTSTGGIISFLTVRSRLLDKSLTLSLRLM
jgi:hypothetical protein